MSIIVHYQQHLLYSLLTSKIQRIIQGKNGETDEELDENCFEEGFQLARVKLCRNGEGGRKALGMGNCSIHI